MRMTTIAAALALTALCAVPARAITVDFSVPLLDQDDRPIKDGDNVLTLGRAAMTALMTPQPDEAAQPVEEKFKKGQLAIRVYAQVPLDLTAEEVAMVRRYIGKTYGPLVVVRALPLLDQPAGGRR